MLRHYRVFNAEQCDDLETPAPAVVPMGKFEKIEAAEQIVAGFDDPPSIEHAASHRPAYGPASDRVTMPSPENFTDRESYYSVLFHELTHATGHSKRLDRGLDPRPPPFGSPDYSKEELVAEMGSAFLAAHAGISPATIEQSAAYIDGWRKKLRDDKKLVVSAAGAGQRAADHILGVSWDEAQNPPTKANDNPPAADIRDEDVDRAMEQSAPIKRDTDDRIASMAGSIRKTLVLQNALRALPSPPIDHDFATTDDLAQVRRYAGEVQAWFADHLDTLIEHGVHERDPRPTALPTLQRRYCGTDLADDLQAFPLPGQANLNSTATREERSAYIAAVLIWFNDRREQWVARGVLDHHRNPEVNGHPADPIPMPMPPSTATGGNAPLFG